MSDTSSPQRTDESVNTTAGGVSQIRKVDAEFRFIDNYGLLLSLGEGGMGEVWAARDASAKKNRIVALKTTKQQGVEAARVLFDEARIQSLIEHPNVCKVHHLGEAGDERYLVMDYCDGGSLHDLLQQVPAHRLPLELAVRIVADTAAGLQAAHDLTDETGTPLGVVHRDVSPQNILISSKGQVTVTDFGVAKALGQAHKATETGEMKGKLAYMAPEQVTSKDVDARADVFALGCVLYQVTLGRRPFHGDDALATLYQLLEEELDAPQTIDPYYPQDLQEIVLRALAKDRNNRFATAADFQRALEQYLVNTGTRVSTDDVADLMNQHLGSRFEERREALRERSEALQGLQERRLKGETSGSASDSGATASHGDAKTLQSRDQARAKRIKKARRNKVLAIFAFCMTSFGGLFIIRALKKPEPSVPVAASSAPAPAPSPTVVEGPSTATIQVQVQVTAVPESARILIDNKEVGSGSYSYQGDASTAGHLLTVEERGYQSVTRALVFDQTKSVHVELSPDKSVGRGAPPTSNTPAKQSPPPSLMENRKATKKPTRTLDSDNPFASSP